MPGDYGDLTPYQVVALCFNQLAEIKSELALKNFRRVSQVMALLDSVMMELQPTDSIPDIPLVGFPCEQETGHAHA